MFLHNHRYVDHYNFNSVSDCDGKLIPKSCIVEHFLIGPKDVGGSCPSPSLPIKYNNIIQCYCSRSCFWSNCRDIKPPQKCLNGVPNSQWVFNIDKRVYQAVRNFKGKNISDAWTKKPNLTRHETNQSDLSDADGTGETVSALVKQGIDCLMDNVELGVFFGGSRKGSSGHSRKNPIISLKQDSNDVALGHLSKMMNPASNYQNQSQKHTSNTPSDETVDEIIYFDVAALENMNAEENRIITSRNKVYQSTTPSSVTQVSETVRESVLKGIQWAMDKSLAGMSKGELFDTIKQNYIAECMHTLGLDSRTLGKDTMMNSVPEPIDTKKMDDKL